MPETFVTYNGVRMVAEWVKRIEDAQRKPTYIIDGRPHERIKYGNESDDWGADRVPCHDCGVIKGQYHVPNACDVERCPVCDEQALMCDCHFEGDDSR
ncbi:MAG TPA: hypothetical protein VJT50_17085 [Pyrinomonadaceae bacterium]|nr:hypothetical protein [Pyrinomonadaceae bacterium]